MVLQGLILGQNVVITFDILTILFKQEILFLWDVEYFNKLLNSLFGLTHFLNHQERQLSLICFELLLKLMRKSCCDFAAINVQTPFGNIFDFGFNLRIPLCEIVNPLADFIKGNIALLPFGHLENLQIGQYLSDLFVVLLDIVMRNTEILMNLLIHLTTNMTVLNRMQYDRTNISKLL